jgi:diaminopimelate epimerase
MSRHAATRLTLTKHHGAGNDFLVVLDQRDEVDLGPGEVVALCDRRRGIGADGVIRVGPGRDGADLSMELRNADGSPAEMSGNGVRCLAQAAVDAGLVAPPGFSVATPAGIRRVEYRRTEGPGHAWASVDMGTPRLGALARPNLWEGNGRAVDVGNPHLVLLTEDPGVLDLAQLGPNLAATVDGGCNVEFVAVGPGADQLTMRVWERGVGETLACGTGSVAAAAAARDWGLVGPTVRVHNPGGTLEVVLGRGEDEPARLAGPVRKTADLVVDRAWLA